MKSKFMNRLRVAALSVAATSAVAQEAEPPVAVKTEGLPVYLRVRIEEKAQHGVTELRRYLDSTKHIHGLRVEFIVKPGEYKTLAEAREENRKLAELSE